MCMYVTGVQHRKDNSDIHKKLSVISQMFIQNISKISLSKSRKKKQRAEVNDFALKFGTLCHIQNIHMSLFNRI